MKSIHLKWSFSIAILMSYLNCILCFVSIPALGYPFYLGMFYDTVTEQMIPGINACKKDSWRINRVEQMIKHQDSMHLEKDIRDRMIILNMPSEMRLSYLSGLMKSTGKIDYIKNSMKSLLNSRVLYDHLFISHREQLETCDLDYNGSQINNILANGLATHIVTDIVYGDELMLLFEVEKGINESELLLKKKLMNLVNVIKNVTQTELSDIENIKSYLYGDGVYSTNIGSFNHSLEAYIKYIKGENHTPAISVPLTVYLSPLYYWKNFTNSHKYEISSTMTFHFERIFASIEHLQARCSDLLRKTKRKYKYTYKNLFIFEKRLKDLLIFIKSKLKEIVPKTRNGYIEIEILEDFLDKLHVYPIDISTLTLWLDNYEIKVNILSSYTSRIKEFIQPESILQNKRYDLNTKYIVNLRINSYIDDEFLHSLKPAIWEENLHSEYNISEIDMVKFNEDFLLTKKNAQYFLELYSTSRYGKSSYYIVNEIENPDIEIGGFVDIYMDGEILNSSSFSYTNAARECFIYKILEDKTRDVGYSATRNCDHDLKKRWYRLSMNDSIVMPNQCVQSGRCGAVSSGWMVGNHPLATDGIVTRNVCFSLNEHCCWRNAFINVRNCSTFVVYEFLSPPTCNLRYCSTNLIELSKH